MVRRTVRELILVLYGSLLLKLVDGIHPTVKTVGILPRNCVTVRNFRVENENKSVDIAERFSTLVHEVAHSLLSHDEVSISDGRKEMEAEAVAYIVCQRLNIETDAVVYISNHLRNEVSDVSDRSEVREIVEGSIERIGEISGQILEEIRQSET